MSKRAGTFVFVVGFLTVLGAVGGIENSTTDAQLWDSTIIALVGLSMIAVSVGSFKRD